MVFLLPYPTLARGDPQEVTPKMTEALEKCNGILRTSRLFGWRSKLRSREKTYVNLAARVRKDPKAPSTYLSF